MLKSSEEILASYVDALHPIIYINHFDSYVVDKTILNISDGCKVVEFNNALGIIDFKTKSHLVLMIIHKIKKNSTRYK